MENLEVTVYVYVSECRGNVTKKGGISKRFNLEKWKAGKYLVGNIVALYFEALRNSANRQTIIFQKLKPFFLWSNAAPMVWHTKV